MHPRTLSLPALLLISLTAISCGSMSYTMPGRLSHNDIAGIISTAHQGEVDQGQAALSGATSADVREFAQMMVTDHGNALSNARDVFARNGITPAENDTSRSLKNTAQQSIANLSGYRGANFDRTYIQAQVDMHQWMLTNLDSLLIPSARGEMRTLLENQRNSVVKHLDHARTVLSKL